MKSMIKPLQRVAHKLTAAVAGGKHPKNLGGGKNQRIKEYEALFHIASTIAGSGSFEDKAKAIVQEIAQT